ncbi:MAG: GGDEF domain-containing protein [Betaproteobacteria bacterium]|nr:GGDEF domain-containing protein [Betaproteobacteria bacterium]
MQANNIRRPRALPAILQSIAFAALCAAWILPAHVSASHAKGAREIAGKPPIEKFSPNIDLFPQHLCVAQDAAGRALICSNDGLVEFDSERWRLTRMPNGEIVRSLAIAADGTTYVGGYNLFGAMRRDAAGVLVFEDLTQKFAAYVKDREFADIWEIAIAPDAVYFRALHDVFAWHPATGKTEHWHHAGRFGWVSAAHGRVTLQFRGEGVKVREGDRWTLLPSGARFKTLMQLWLPLRDGRTLVIADDGSWWKVDAEGVAAPLSRPKGIARETAYVHGVELPDDGVALATVSGEVLFVDSEGSAAHAVALEAGFVTGLAVSRDGGVLATVQGNLYRIGWPATWTVLGQEHGLSGTFTSLVDWNGTLHLLASGGIHRATATSAGLRFQRMPGIASVPQHLYPLDHRRALLAESRHLALIEDGRIRNLTPETVYPREFMRSRFHPGRVFLLTEHGLRTIDLRNGIGVSRPLPDKDGVLISTLVEVSATEAWAGTQRHGVIRFTLGDDGQLRDAKFMGHDTGLDAGQVEEAYVGEAGPRDAAGRPDWVVSTSRGLFRWEGARFRPDAMDGLDRARKDGESFIFVTRQNGDVWAYGNTRLFHKAAGRAGWRQQEIRPLLRGAFVHHTELPNDQLAFVTSSGVLIHHGTAAGESARVSERSPHALRMMGVTLDHRGKSIRLPLTPSAPIEIAEGEFSLRFEFALPEMVHEGFKRYQGQMIGEEEKMSDWGLPSRYTYYNLRAGDFAMRIRGMDSEGRVAEMPDYRFTVVPPWHSRGWAKALYVLGTFVLAGLLMLLSIRVRTERLKHANLDLEMKIDARTQELAEANRRLEMMAHMDGLTGIANRRSLDTYLPAVWSQCREQHRPLSVMIIDADHFKQYNDTHGHVAGDDLLKSLTRHLLNQLRRAEDFLARYGGEEFVVLLPGADASVAATMAEAMRKSIAESPLGITVSIGTCTAIPSSDPPEALIARADRALYEAKSAGRNRVRVCAEC